MNKKVVITIIVGVCLIVFGGLLALFGYFQGGFDSLTSKDSDRVRVISKEDIIEEKTEELPEFTSMDMDLMYGPVEIIRGDNYSITFINYIEDFIPSYQVEDGVLKAADTSGSAFNMQINTTFTAENKVVITVPQDGEITDITLKTDGGEVTMADLTLNNLNIVNSYDDVVLTNINCASLTFKGDWTDLELNTVSAGTANISGIENLKTNGLHGDLWTIEAEDGTVALNTAEIGDVTITSDYGDVLLDGFTGAALSINGSDSSMEMVNSTVDAGVIKSEYGDVKISDSETKGLQITTEGAINLSGTFLGTSEIIGEYEDIKVSVNGKEADYGYSLKTEYGTSTINGEKVEGSYTVRSATGNQINCTSSDGDITLNFQD